jgi:hypothetical protein
LLNTVILPIYYLKSARAENAHLMATFPDYWGYAQTTGAFLPKLTSQRLLKRSRSIGASKAPFLMPPHCILTTV